MATANFVVQPYLFFNGRCEEALEFYRSTVGAEVEMIMRFSESPEPATGLPPGSENKIMHASFRIGASTLMASDGRCAGEAQFAGFTLSITATDEPEADRIFNALAEGGRVEMPMMPTFWAPRFGILEDRFGVGWMVSVAHNTDQ